MTMLPRRRTKLMMMTLSILATCLAATPLFADQPNAAPFAAMGIMFLFMFLAFAALYIYVALAFQTIAKKTNTENAWWAWIPILNLILLANIAKKPIWWGLLCLVPVVGIVFMILLCMAVAEARHKANWWGILMIVPGVNLIVPGYLAWSE